MRYCAGGGCTEQDPPSLLDRAAHADRDLNWARAGEGWQPPSARRPFGGEKRPFGGERRLFGAAPRRLFGVEQRPLGVEGWRLGGEEWLLALDRQDFDDTEVCRGRELRGRRHLVVPYGMSVPDIAQHEHSTVAYLSTANRVAERHAVCQYRTPLSIEPYGMSLGIAPYDSTAHSP
eukprot:2594941-Rhodomonas_salina.2